ncbi:Gram-negative bacterial tonB protein [compost metagenome]
MIEACFVIGTDGKIKDVTFTDPNRPEFMDVPVRRALIRWRFEPATRDGVPVEQRGCYAVQIRQRGGGY